MTLQLYNSSSIRPSGAVTSLPIYWFWYKLINTNNNQLDISLTLKWLLRPFKCFFSVYRTFYNFEHVLSFTLLGPTWSLKNEFLTFSIIGCAPCNVLGYLKMSQVHILLSYGWMLHRLNSSTDWTLGWNQNNSFCVPF